MPTFRLTKLVGIYRNDKPVSDFGYSGSDSTHVCSAWAQITPLTAAERVNAEQIVSTATHKCIIRWTHRQIEAAMHVRCDSDTYEIASVTDMSGAGEYIELIVTRLRDATGTNTTR